ncbi:MAG TPA: N-acetyl-gamma-glutamyl-phosphate reductase [Candidatus Thermoplasmatota archaeon]|jgi:N-acetyl-gamma-glutamyl-phosphate reductase|nr:N-acetyl-gamma-glutamyl-phosphate reductase [Candidatus Thermoplasmatota archaeon]
MPQATVGIAGATGYTGAELLRLLLAHPHAEIGALSSNSHTGRSVGTILPQFAGVVPQEFVKTEAASFAASDAVFVCLPSGAAGQLAAQLHKANPEQRVIDLSADLRLKDPQAYEAWYKRPHPAPELLPKAAYGLPELFRSLLRGSTLIANPGCYPTGALLALAPLVRLGLSDGPFLVDSKSGVSGAGRETRDDLHFPEANEALKAYGIGTHRHTPEIEQGLAQLGGHGAPITFTPHLVPMNRGILTTAYAPAPEGLTQEQLTKGYAKLYAGEPFVQLVDAPDVKHVRGSNQCHLAVHLVERTRTIVAISAIDNLVKGAAGQAVQTMNLLLGLPETDGLPRSGASP